MVKVKIVRPYDNDNEIVVKGYWWDNGELFAVLHISPVRTEFAISTFLSRIEEMAYDEWFTRNGETILMLDFDYLEVWRMVVNAAIEIIADEDPIQEFIDIVSEMDSVDE